MTSGLNVFVSGMDDGTKRQNVPDYLVSLRVEWTDSSGAPQSFEHDEYLLVMLNWLRNNHPAKARELMHDIVVLCARLYYGVDEP